MQIRVRTALALLGMLTSCGGDDSPSAAPATTGVSLSPAPAPSPTPSPSPSPTPIPSPTPTAVAIEPYALGTLTYTLDPNTPADKRDAIRDAMDFAVDHANVLGAFSGNVYVVYEAGVQTADASYRGAIRFGGMIGRRVALHELAHWFGSGTTDQWDRIVRDGRFTGERTTARIKAYKGDEEYLHADWAHFWLYGLNYDNEYDDTQRNTQILSAQIADMGLGDDVTPAIAGTRRFQNRSSGLVLQAVASSAYPLGDASVSGGSQQWRVTFADGFITLTNVADGRMIEASGSGNNVAAMMASPNTSRLQQWEMKPTGDGWFLICNRATGNCLDNIGNVAAAAPVRLWGTSWHPNQQWRLIR